MKEGDSKEEDWVYDPAGDEEIPLGRRSSSELREVGLVGALGHMLWRRAIFAYLKWRHPLTITGKEHLPRDTPFVLVANHISHLDAMVLGSLFAEGHFLGRVFALAAGDFFFDSPTKSLVATQMVNALPVWRGKPSTHALKHLRQRLEHGRCGYIVFPEGTRSRSGEMAEFKPGIGMIVAGTSVPVIPCHLKGCFEAWPPDAKWPKAGKIELTICPARSYENQPNRRAGWEAISKELEAVVRGEEPDRQAG